tara:strand:- start:783 stop:1265 length:483 start_codon:yes stop_codon:yes gene_type:complete
MKRNEQKMVQLIREEYNNRILELFRENVKDIFEADMFDREGNQLLSPGLKVRHKKSGYEYTVDHVEGKGEDAVVFLRHPESPRFKPPQAETQLTEGEEDDGPRIKVDQVDLNKVMGTEGELDPTPARASTEDPMDIMKQQTKGSLLKITRKEFEKEYEVK